MDTGKTDNIVDSLVTLLGPNAVLQHPEDYARYTQDWAGHRLGEPLAVVRPKTTEEVAGVVRLCQEHGIRMVPQGGHTGLVGGALPDKDNNEIVISLERMNRVHSLDPIGFTMTVDGGCVLEDIKRAAEEQACFFPLSLGAQGSCQIGGNIATNAGGLNVLRYGMTRELVLGLEVVLPDGRIWNGMTALRKDNRGYDLKQLFIGSEGTLGIITAAVLKLFPKPEQTQTALLAIPSVAAAMQIYTLARRSCSDLLSAFELIPRQCMELAFEAAPQLADPLDKAYPYYVLLETAATGPVDLAQMMEHFLEQGMTSELILDGVLATSSAQAHQLWFIRESMLEGQRLRGEHLRTDVSVPISALADFVEAATAVVTSHSPELTVIPYGHVGDGNLHFNILPPRNMPAEQAVTALHEVEELIFDVLDRFDGSISAEHGIGRIKQHAYLSRISDDEKALMISIKRTFDPHCLMAADRILPASMMESSIDK